MPTQLDGSPEFTTTVERSADRGSLFLGDGEHLPSMGMAGRVDLSIAGSRAMFRPAVRSIAARFKNP